LPAAAAASINSTCIAFGAAMKTTSTSESSMTRRQSAAPRLYPKDPIASSTRAGTASLQITSSGSNSRSGNSVLIRCIERLWAWPSQPKPIRPTPMRRRAALSPEGADLGCVVVTAAAAPSPVSARA
jgi:hypothetical protein